MISKNISYKRGDNAEFTIPVDGEYLTDLKFVVKADYEVTSARLVEKIIDAGLDVDYDETADMTYITITFDASDMADLEAKMYFYDIVYDEMETLVGGQLNLIADVQTPFDGTGSLPSDGRRVQVVGLAEEGDATDLYLKWNNTLRLYEPITLEELRLDIMVWG